MSLNKLNISDLISILQDKKEKYGDLDVYIINGLYKDPLSEQQVRIIVGDNLTMVIGSKGW